MRMVSEDKVLDALRGVKDPQQQKDIVTLGLVRDLRISDAEVAFTLAFTDQSPQSKAAMHSMASRLVGQLPGVSKVKVAMGGAAQPARPAPQPHAHGQAPAGIVWELPFARLLGDRYLERAC